MRNLNIIATAIAAGAIGLGAGALTVKPVAVPGPERTVTVTLPAPSPITVTKTVTVASPECAAAVVEFNDQLILDNNLIGEFIKGTASDTSPAGRAYAGVSKSTLDKLFADAKACLDAAPAQNSGS